MGHHMPSLNDPKTRKFDQILVFPRWEGSTSRNRKTMASFQKKKGLSQDLQLEGSVFFYSVFSKFMSGCRCLFLLVFLLCFSASSLFRLSACPFPCFLRFYVSLISFFFIFFTSLLFCQINTKPTLYIYIYI